MLLTLWDPDTLIHQTVELLGSKLIPALESPDRLRAILKSLHGSEHELRTLEFGSYTTQERVNRLLHLTSETHDANYLLHLRSIFQTWLDAGLLKEDGHVLPECFVFPTATGKPPRAPKDPFARAGYYAFDMSSGIMSESYKAIVASANLACEGTDMLSGFARLPNDIDTVVALCRPPGHHCDGQRAGGYCYINNAALAVSTWRSTHTDAQIGILDIDFHHGNGTQQIFYADPKVLYVSIHGEDEFVSSTLLDTHHPPSSFASIDNSCSLFPLHEPEN
jgi:acetoin utilization deacetylase AcuC-like enzyme